MKKLYALSILLLLLPSVSNSQEFEKKEFYIPVTDKGNNGSSTAKISCKPEKIDGKEVFAATMTGKVTKQFEYGFIQMMIEPDAALLAKLKKAKGIRFKCTGDNKLYRIKLGTRVITDFDYHGKSFRAGSKVKEVVVMFNSAQQEGWGAKKSFSSESLYALLIQTIGQPHSSITLRIFDLQIIN